MMLLNKLKQIQLRSNSVLGDRSKTALLTKRKRRCKSKTKQNFYSNKNLNSTDSFSKKIRNNTAKNVKSHLLGRPQTQQNTHELDQYQNLSENQNLSLEYNTAANANFESSSEVKGEYHSVSNIKTVEVPYENQTSTSFAINQNHDIADVTNQIRSKILSHRRKEKLKSCIIPNNFANNLSKSMCNIMKRKRFNEMSKIHNDNIFLLERLQKGKSVYSIDSFREKRKVEEKLLKNISNFPCDNSGLMFRSKTRKVVNGTILSMANYLNKITPLKFKRRSKSSQGLKRLPRECISRPINITENNENLHLEQNENTTANIESPGRISPIILSGEINASNVVVCTEPNPRQVQRKRTAKSKSIPILSKFEHNCIKSYGRCANIKIQKASAAIPLPQPRRIADSNYSNQNTSNLESNQVKSSQIGDHKIILNLDIKKLRSNRLKQKMLLYRKKKRIDGKSCIVEIFRNI